jgi:two-component system phosphate regulon sensor histidine kinase PhoR
MSFNAWLSEFNRILIVFIPCGIVGLITGQVPWLLVLGLIIYGLWTARQLVTLKQWLDDGASVEEAPEYLGIADQHVSSIVDLQKQHLAAEVKFQGLIDQYDLMIAALPDAIVVMKASGEITSANQAATKLLHIHRQTDLKTRITQLVRKPSFVDYFNAQKFDQPLEIRGSSAKEPELSVRIIPFGDGKLVLIAQDMSQSARIYEMRRSFISNASHELRTPLTVILGYLESLTMNPELPEKCITAIQAAEVQAQRMKQLVEDLLILSRLESTSAAAQESDVIPINSLIAEVVEDAKLASWFDKHNISTDIDSSLKLKGDFQEIHSVVSNLVNNALKHTPKGTNIKIIWGLDTEGNPELIVQDDGQGIAAEHIDRLTERFYRVDAGRSREKGGTGLGLSIVKHIISRHEGSFSVNSKLGLGSAFICNFPAHRAFINQNNTDKSKAYSVTKL